MDDLSVPRMPVRSMLRPVGSTRSETSLPRTVPVAVPSPAQGLPEKIRAPLTALLFSSKNPDCVLVRVLLSCNVICQLPEIGHAAGEGSELLLPPPQPELSKQNASNETIKLFFISLGPQ